jgi:CBS domain-containing protein
MTTLRAEQIMRQPVLAATRRAAVRDIITHLVVNGISGMPVTEPDGTVVGVVTEGDILRVLVERDPLNQLTAQDIMSSDPVTVDTGTPVPDVMYTLHQEAILRVPVTKAGKLVGIISRSDIIRAVAEREGDEEPDFLTF